MTGKMTSPFILILLCLVVLSACTTDSEDLNTSGIEAKMSVIISETSAIARADLSVAGGTGPIELSSGDVFYAKPDISTRKQLVRSGRDGRYEADFSLNDFSTTFNFSFERNDDSDNDALNSTVTLPALFNITFPAANAEYAKTDSIQVTWDNPIPAKTVIFEMTPTCSDSLISQTSFLRVTQVDDGDYTIDDLDKFYPVGPNVACDLKIDVIRRQTGSADSNLAGGSELNADRVDSVTVKLLAD